LKTRLLLVLNLIPKQHQFSTDSSLETLSSSRKEDKYCTVGPGFALLAALDSPEEEDNDQVMDTGILDANTDTEHTSEYVSMHITTNSTVHNDDPLLTDSAGASDMSTSTLAHFLNNR
jgi:hypothetical protein